MPLQAEWYQPECAFDSVGEPIQSLSESHGHSFARIRDSQFIGNGLGQQVSENRHIRNNHFVAQYHFDSPLNNSVFREDLSELELQVIKWTLNIRDIVLMNNIALRKIALIVEEIHSVLAVPLH